MRNYNICVKAALAVFTGLLSACSSDNDIAEKEPVSPEKPIVSQTMTFHASMDGENTTRTSFDNSNNTVWSDGDAIHVLNTADVQGENANNYPTDGGDFTIPSGGGGGKAADFTGSPIWINGEDNDQFFAFYPSSSYNSISQKMTGNIPNVQTAMDGTYDQSLHFMTAYSTNSTFAFKNVCALLKITLNGNSTDNSNPVCRVKVVANPKLESVVSKINTVLGVETSRDYDQSFTYTSIAGNFEATVKDDGTATATPKLAEGEVEKTYVELRASGDDGTAKTSLGNGTFYMVVLPAALSKDDVIYGFTIILEKKDGTIYQRVNTKQEAFERNKMYDLGIYDCSSTPTGMTSLGKDVVDLDLPSGTLWCKYNIKKDGSFESSETGFTDYFSWGYDHVVLTGSYSSFYEDDPATNFSLYTDYDMAYKKDNRYCMPVYAQMYEMYNHTNKVIEKDTHTTGWPVSFTITDAAWAKFTAATGTGRCIKIPYAGYYYDALPHNVKEEGRYWSRTKASNVTGYAGNAFCMDLINDDVSINGDWVDDANCGRSIRPVATNIKIAPILTK